MELPLKRVYWNRTHTTSHAGSLQKKKSHLKMLFVQMGLPATPAASTAGSETVSGGAQAAGQQMGITNTRHFSLPLNNYLVCSLE